MADAEIFQLAEHSARRRKPTVEYDTPADVIELKGLRLPTQRDDSVPEVGRRALSDVVILDEEPVYDMPVEGKVTVAVGSIVVLLYNYADKIAGDSLNRGPGEQVIMKNEVSDILTRIDKIEEMARAMIEQGNSPQYVNKSILQGLANSRPDLYLIACGQTDYGA